MANIYTQGRKLRPYENEKRRRQRRQRRQASHTGRKKTSSAYTRERKQEGGGAMQRLRWLRWLQLRYSNTLFKYAL